MSTLNKYTGSSFDSWLQEEGVLEEVTSIATNRVLARQNNDAMTEQGHDCSLRDHSAFNIQDACRWLTRN